MATNTTFSEEHELIGINGKCNFVTTANGQLIKGVYSRK